jgi:hypothetical protein
MDVNDELRGSGRMLNLDNFESEEKRLLDSLADSLRRDFPNPTRIGCPEIAVLRGLVSQQLPHAEVRRWLPHLATCGECFKQCENLRGEAEGKRHRKTLWLAASAAILVIVVLAGWLIRRVDQPGTAATEVLDLRHVSPLSEAPELQTAQMLVLHRSTRHVVLKQTTYAEGVTVEEIAVFTDNGTNLFDTTASPQLEDQILLIRIDLDLSRFDSGYYRLAVRRPGLSWTQYRLHVR